MNNDSVRTAGPETDFAKLREMICYFAELGGEALGKTKLMKLLYYSDFGFYALNHRSISGATYFKYPRGPVPEDALRELPKMIAEKILLPVPKSKGNYIQESHVVQKPTPPNSLDSLEIAQLEKVWKRWELADASTIVSATHSEAPWRSVDLYEEIPYEMAYFLSH